MIDPKFTLPVSGFLYINEENEIPIYLSGQDISLTLCSRTAITSNLGNYFVSLNLPAEKDHFPTNSSLSFFFPELQQLNVENILLIKIPNTAYTEFIDARSIKLNLPGTGNSEVNFYTLFSSTYSDSEPNKYGERSPLLGDNIAYLFSDSVNLPYTGLSVNQIDQLISHSAVTSWNPNTRNYYDRPSATSYAETKLSNDSINTDRRYLPHRAVFTDGLYPDYRGIGQSFYNIANSTWILPGPPPVAVSGYGLFVKPNENFFRNGDPITIDLFDKTNTTHNKLSGNTTIKRIIRDNSTNKFFKYSPDPNYGGPWDILVIQIIPTVAVPAINNIAGYVYTSGGTYYNYDIPIGFVVLDKGLICVTHTDIVNSIDWTLGYLQDGSPSDGTIGSGTTNIYFTDTDTSIYGDEEAIFSLNFTSLDTIYKMRAVCNSLIGEFYISNNPTWDDVVANNPFAENMNVAITEVGLYNEMNELVALAKFSEPIFKGQYDLMTFELDINL